MRQVLFVQGAGADVHAAWDGRLVDDLRAELGPGYEIRYPVMPNETDPRFAEWRRALEGELAALGDGAVLVGHSVGGAVLVNALADRTPPFRVGAIALIAAPFIGPGGWDSDEVEPRPDLGARLPRGVPVFLYHGENDETVPISHVELYAQAIPHARVRRLPDRDHQLDDDLAELASDIRALGSANDAA